MFIPTYEVKEIHKRVEYWDSLLAEHIKKIEAEAKSKAAEDADLSSMVTNNLPSAAHTPSHSLNLTEYTNW